MGKGGNPVLRLATEPWFGLVTDYREKDHPWNVAFKGLVDVRAWDGMTHTWWMPLSYMRTVVPIAREHKVVTDAEVNRAMEEIALKTRTKVETGSEVGDLYAMLGLHPSAPPLLCEWALFYWRRELGSIGAPTTRLLQIEEAYRKLFAPKVSGA